MSDIRDQQYEFLKNNVTRDYPYNIDEHCKEETNKRIYEDKKYYYAKMYDYDSEYEKYFDDYYNLCKEDNFFSTDISFPYIDKDGNELTTSDGTPIKSIYEIFFVDKDLNIYFLATNMKVFFYNEDEYYMWIKIGDETFEEHQFYAKEGYKIERTDIYNMDNYYDRTFFNVKVRIQDGERIEGVVKLKDPEWELIKTNLGRTLMELEYVTKYKNINIYSTETEEEKYIPLLKYDGSDEFIEIDLYYKDSFLRLHPLHVTKYYLRYTNSCGDNPTCKLDEETGEIYDDKYLGKLIIEKRDNKLETIDVKMGWFSTFNIYRISDYISIRGVDGRQFYKAMNDNGEVAWFERGLEKEYISMKNLWFDDVSDIYYNEETQNYYYDAMLGGQWVAIKFLSNEMKEIFDEAKILLKKAEKMEGNRQRLEEIQKKREQKLKELQELTKATEELHSEIHNDFQDIKEINDHKDGLVVQLHDEISDQIKGIYDKYKES